MSSVLLLLDLSEHGDDEVDGGAAGHQSGHRHHEARVLAVTHGDRDLKHSILRLEARSAKQSDIQ